MPDWVEYLLRILLAIGLGFIIGIERQLRLKVAGIRTHAVVAGGACLFMIISKYGFTDAASFDASRVASQVVSGISFIGAGMILHRQQAVHGLTSAAGIWMTAAIGMAAGAGLYYIALGATAVILLVQCLMHIPCRLFREKRYSEIVIVFTGEDAELQNRIKAAFGVKNFADLKAERREGKLVFTATIDTEKCIDDEFIRQTLIDNPDVLSVKRLKADV